MCTEGRGPGRAGALHDPLAAPVGTFIVFAAIIKRFVYVNACGTTRIGRCSSG